VQNFTAYPQMPDVKALVEYGIRMEQLGFDSLWVWDHILLGVDPNFPIIESLTQQHQGRRHRTSYGRVAASGNFVVDGARIAVDDINAKGGGDGFREGHKFKRGRLANLPNGPDAKVESLARGPGPGNMAARWGQFQLAQLFIPHAIILIREPLTRRGTCVQELPRHSNAAHARWAPYFRNA
jgi:hypothetical protein